MGNKRLSLSRKNRIISGVCGGFAEYFNLDAAIMRIIWAVFTLIFLPSMMFSFTVYIICWAVMPNAD